MIILLKYINDMTYAKTGLKWRYLHMTALGFRGRNTWGCLPKKESSPGSYGMPIPNETGLMGGHILESLTKYVVTGVAGYSTFILTPKEWPVIKVLKMVRFAEKQAGSHVAGDE